MRRRNGVGAGGGGGGGGRNKRRSIRRDIDRCSRFSGAKEENSLIFLFRGLFGAAMKDAERADNLMDGGQQSIHNERILLKGEGRCCLVGRGQGKNCHSIQSSGV